ncbi:MAG TPA: serine O-acetyltransferase [Clostridia bacterium]|nr:serine O-acetyltransferase [Clostridia bacterium]
MTVREELKLDLKAAMDKDPAAKSKWLVKHTYSGYKALTGYRYAHWFYERGHFTIAELISAHTKRKTGVEIHPAAKIGISAFIDHGTGIVIGETAEIGTNCVLYQGVTLGGTGKDTGKRHPTLGNNVMVSAGAKVLGPLTIGDGSKIGAGSVVLKNVPPYCTVVGVPGRIVKQDGERIADMDQILLPDPIMEEFKRLNSRLYELEKKLGVHACRYSLTVDEVNELTDEAEKHD